MGGVAVKVLVDVHDEVRGQVFGSGQPVIKQDVFVDPPPGGRGSGFGPVPLAVLELRDELNELTGVEQFAVAMDDGGDLLRRVRHQLVRLGDTGE
jgi:hypothetical protein